MAGVIPAALRARLGDDATFGLIELLETERQEVSEQVLTSAADIVRSARPDKDRERCHKKQPRHHKAPETEFPAQAAAIGDGEFVHVGFSRIVGAASVSFRGNVLSAREEAYSIDALDHG